ncbi:hypothetical protein MTO96_043514, partial [Rhipicephalus appendiculatus]
MVEGSTSRCESTGALIEPIQNRVGRRSKRAWGVTWVRACWRRSWFLMVTMALLVVVFLASSGDEKDNTASDVFNNDITDFLERDGPGANLNPATST